MIDDWEFTLAKPSCQLAAFAASKGPTQPMMKNLGHHLARAKRAKKHEHRGSSGFEQLREASRHRPQIDDTIEWRKVGERTVEAFSACGEMTSSEILHLLSSG